MAGNTRSEKSAKNLIYGVGAQSASILLNFVIRIVLVRQVGILSVSLNGLFTEVIAMLSLAEMGVGSAITYSLYKPLAARDEKRIVKLMNLYKTAYRNIAFAVLAAGLCLVPFIQNIVSKVDVPDNYIRLVFVLFLIQTASSYLFSYKSALLNADQNVYLVSKITTIVKIAAEIVNIGLLFMFQNYLLYLVMEVLAVVAANIVISGQVDKMYPFLNRKDELLNVEKKLVFKNVKNIFIGSLSGRITNSTDNILISMLVSIYEVGIYTSYSTLAGGLRHIIDQIDSATAGSVGNLMAEADGKRCNDVIKRMTFINYFFGSLFACCLFCLSSTLVRIMYGEKYTYNTDTIYGIAVIFIISLNFFVTALKNPLWRFVSVSGLFSKDKNISIAGSTANLIISVVLGLKLGTLGILLGTFATLAIQIVLKIRLLYTGKFKMSPFRYYLLFTVYGAAGVTIMMMAKFISSEIVLGNLYLDLLLKALVSITVPLCMNYIVFGRTKEFDYLKEIMWRFLGKFYSVFEVYLKKYRRSVRRHLNERW